MMEFEFLEPIRQGVRVRSRGTALVRGRITQMLFRD
jgi:hypothetical protein